jgi:hypothetical protein
VAAKVLEVAAPPAIPEIGEGKGQDDHGHEEGPQSEGFAHHLVSRTTSLDVDIDRDHDDMRGKNRGRLKPQDRLSRIRDSIKTSTRPPS